MTHSLGNVLIARELLLQMCKDGVISNYDATRAEQVVAAALATAENEALERAAQEIEGMYIRNLSEQAWAAQRIRALKGQN